MKVLQVVEATTAGVGRHVLDLSAHIRRVGLGVTVACPRVREGAQQDTSFVEKLGAAGVPVAVVPMRRSIHPPADLRSLALLVKLIRREKFDVVHAHSSKAGVLGRLAAWRVGVPAVVYTPNAFAFLGARGRLARWFYLAIERWLGRHATGAVVCVSRSELALARHHAIAPPERLALVENTIDASRFASAAPAPDLRSDRPLVGFIGRLSPQKGVSYFIQAARRVLDAGIEAQFALVGEGELDVGRMVAEQDLNEHVVLTGYRPDIPQVLAALDIFALPSLYEGLPYTLMEAMAAGRPVVATSVEGNRDLIQDGETGLLIPPRDAEALAGALIRLLSAPEERVRLGKMALAAARSRPTPEQMAQRMIELYLEILG